MFGRNRDAPIRWRRILSMVVVVAVAGAGLSIGGGIFGRIFFPGKPPPPPATLPPEVVKELIVDQEVLNENAVLKARVKGLRIRNGVLELEDGRKVEVIRQLMIETSAGPPPEEEIEAVDEILETVCEEHVRPVYKTYADLFEFQGVDNDEPGEETYGWTGQIGCLMAAPDSEFWATVHRRELTMANTRILSTQAPPKPLPKKRWTAGVHIALVTDGFSFSQSRDQYDTPVSFAFDPTKIRGYGGMRVFPRKRYTPELIVWAESGAAGIGLGVDF